MDTYVRVSRSRKFHAKESLHIPHALPNALNAQHPRAVADADSLTRRSFLVAALALHAFAMTRRAARRIMAINQRHSKGAMIKMGSHITASASPSAVPEAWLTAISDNSGGVMTEQKTWWIVSCDFWTSSGSNEAVLSVVAAPG